MAHSAFTLKKLMKNWVAFTFLTSFCHVTFKTLEGKFAYFWDCLFNTFLPFQSQQHIIPEK